MLQYCALNMVRLKHNGEWNSVKFGTYIEIIEMGV